MSESQNTPDKDKKIKLMNDLLKTNQRHINHLKQMNEQLKKQLQFEQKQREDLLKENQVLKKQVQKLKLQLKENQDFSDNNKPSSLNNFDFISDTKRQSSKFQTEELTSEQKLSMKKIDLKINVQNVINQTSKMQGPLTSVKKSYTYIQQINNQKLNDQMLESIVVLREGGSNKNTSIVKQKDQFIFNPSQIQELTTEEAKSGEELNLQLQKSIRLKDFKLFEQFYILGTNKIEFQEFDHNQSIQEGILPACILYRYNPTDEKQCQYEYIIPEFAYPFGVKVEKIKINDSFRKLKEFQSNKIQFQQNHLMDKFYIFTMKNQEQEQQNDISFSTNEKLLLSCNPEKLLYGICLSVYDYIESTPPDIPLTTQNRKKRTFWKYKKTYCFLTYFPFFELFQDILISIISDINQYFILVMIKMSRIDRFIQKSTEEYEVLQEIDGQSILKELSTQTKESLDRIKSVSVQKFEQILEFETLAGNIKYQIPSKDNMQQDLKAWSAGLVLQLLSYTQLVTIFLAIMQEISIVFICQKISVLTAVVHFFHHLLNPIKWIHPIIYTLPESLLPLLESPVPIIVGLSLSNTYLKELQILENNDNLLYVFIDTEVKIVCKPIDLIKSIKTPFFDGKLGQIEQLFRNSVSMRNPSPGPQKKNGNNSKQLNQVRFVMEEKDRQDGKKLIRMFYDIIKDYIVNKLPPNQENVNFDNIEKLVIQNSHTKDRDFIRNLSKTQFFTYFVNEFYQNK